jgi:hypothetical protein
MSKALLDATVKESVAGPLPELPPGNVIHDASALAVQEQPRPVPSDAVPWPPADENVTVALETL